jgi:hypothetical protein
MSNSYQNFLKKLKWIDTSTLSFTMSRQEFEERLQKHLDPYRAQGMFEAFSSSPNDYVGKIEGDELLMRRKRKIFDWSMGSVLVNSQIKEEDGKVHLEARIEFPSWVPGMVLGFFVVIYGFALIAVLAGAFADEVPMMGLFIVLHFIFLFSIFYFIMRMGISSTKAHFERDMRNYLAQSPKKKR